MKGRMVALFLLVCGAFSLVIFNFIQVGSSRKTNPSAIIKKQPHLANFPEVKIDEVNLKVVYFSPKDLVEYTKWPWFDEIAKAANEQNDFFNFHLGTKINYLVYPNVVIGYEDHSVYDGNSTENGNPNALVAVREEILERIFTDHGDLYDPSFSQKSDRYEILLIIYEGTGGAAMIYQSGAATGTDVVKIEPDGLPAIILSSAYLNSDFYKEFGTSILAHEIGHSFGLSDSYNLENGNNLASDIMGEGRRRRLNTAYISQENKKLLGL